MSIRKSPFLKKFPSVDRKVLPFPVLLPVPLKLIRKGETLRDPSTKPMKGSRKRDKGNVQKYRDVEGEVDSNLSVADLLYHHRPKKKTNRFVNEKGSPDLTSVDSG